VLLRLGRMLDEKPLIDRAERLLRTTAPLLEKSPTAFPQLAVALHFALSPPLQIVIAGSPDEPGTRELLQEIRAHFLPHRVLLFADGKGGPKWLTRRLPFLRSVTQIEGRPTAYVCENFVCDLPTSDPARVRELLQQKASHP